MEIAIPMALMGGMYILSNQDSTNTSSNSNRQQQPIQNKNIQQPKQVSFQENFQSSNPSLAKHSSQALPNMDTPQQNYPVETSGLTELSENVNYYDNPNTHTDRYFGSSYYEEEASKDPSQFMSLTGNVINKEDFKHKNMKPFFGAKITQNLDFDRNESRLDMMNGSGSQHMRKQEQAPLFKPEQNTQWAYGTPNTSDFIQSRMNPSATVRNVKPWQEVRVGPGLDQRGGVLGSGGFNSGMEAREKWMPKTVDELRVATNQKQTYEGTFLGGKTNVTNRGNMGKMEKHRPDTYFINSPERYFTTTGIEKAQTARSGIVMKEENRNTTTSEYYGAGDNATGSAMYVPGQVAQTRRPELRPNAEITMSATPQESDPLRLAELNKQSYRENLVENNRTLTHNEPQRFGLVSSLVKAIVSPIMDIVRPTKKQNFVGNIRTYGNGGGNGVNASYVYNPAEKARTTIREMTEDHKGHKFIGNQREAGGYGYTVANPTAVEQQRETTTQENLGNMNRQRDLGGYGYTVANPIAVGQQRDTTSFENMGNINNQGDFGGGYGYLTNEQQAYAQHRDTTSVHYTGSGGATGGNVAPRTYDAEYNANLIDKEPLSRGRNPMGSNVKLFNGQSSTNIQINKLDYDRQNNRMYAPHRVTAAPPMVENYGQLTTRSEFGQDINLQRNSPEILSAFHNNPYTKPLNSIA